MVKRVKVDQYTRTADFGDLRRSVPKGVKAPRKGGELLKHPVTGKFLKAGEKIPKPWEAADALIDRFTKDGRSTIDAFNKALDVAIERESDEYWEKIAEALRSMESDDRSEPAASLFYRDSDEPATIGGYHNDLEDFTVEWHGQGYRGYYEVVPVDENKWKKVHDDNILSMSEDAENLKTFDELIRKAMDDNNIEYVRAFARSSNVFSTGYELFVEADQAERVESLINMLAPIYRDPKKYAVTAYTGKDPKNVTQADVAALNISGIAFSNEPEENKKEMIREQLKLAGFDPDLADKFMKKE